MKKELLYRYGKARVTAIFLLMLIGCKGYLEVDLPQNQVLTPKVFESNETANSAILNIFGQMQAQLPNAYHISFVTGISGDELKTYAAASKNFYTNVILSSDNNINSYWNLPYNYIFQANAAYEGCEKSETLTPDVKKNIKAEALFVRAYWHFYLFNIFGDIPVITTTRYQTNALVVRKPKSEVYAQIIADLNAAIPDLKSDYVAADGLTTSNERIRPNKFTAIALLARAYLYNEEYAKAEEQSSLVISNNSQYSIVGLNDVFLANSKEAIWQLKAVSPNTTNTPEGSIYVLTTSPVTSSGSEISTQLLEAFDSSDLRKSSWIGLYTDNTGKKFYYPNKYKVKTGADLKEYSMIFRLAEQYLIRAEARAQQNNLSGAISDLDVIRDRAKIPKIADINSGINKVDLLLAILKERQRELFTEQGHRWFDLKRTKTIDAVMSIVTPLKQGPAWNTNKQFFPIPQSEIAANPNLKQNTGYN